MATKQLILLRHAKSDWNSGARDIDRPLNPRGRKDAARVGRWFRDSPYCPQKIICSSAERTSETLQLLLDETDWDSTDIEYNPKLYLASERQILDIASDNLIEFDQIMLVGHNPGMDYTLHTLCPGVKTRADGKLMTTAAFAIIQIDDEQLGNPRLAGFFRSGDL